jgi:hypothetical protein
MVSVNVSEFNANSPLDYADLNKMVLAIRDLASKIPTVTTAAPTGTATATTSETTFLTSSYTAALAPPVTSKSTGTQYTIKYTRQGVPVTFSSPPFVIAWVSTGKAGAGLAIINKAGDTTTTGFDVRIGWVARASAGNVSVAYLAIGNELKS